MRKKHLLMGVGVTRSSGMSGQSRLREKKKSKLKNKKGQENEMKDMTCYREYATGVESKGLPAHCQSDLVRKFKESRPLMRRSVSLPVGYRLAD